MGSCQVIMHKKLLEKIQQSPYDVIVRVLKAEEWGEDNLYQVHIETDVLSAGYHGQQEIILDENMVRFRRDTDT